MSSDLIAALDVGKTHTRLSIIDPQAGTEIWNARSTTHSLDTSLGRQLPVATIEQWLIEALKNAPNRDRIAAVVPIAHGAAAILLDDRGQILAAPDYEEANFERVKEAYEAERDPFERTFSPSLPLGLNLGRQLFYFEKKEPQVFSRVAHVLLYPQYWAWRLSGVMACEVTSLGCHSDLWLPQVREFSRLARRRGWFHLFPSQRFAGETLGLARGPTAEVAGLAPNCRIVCGIHDSNASYLRYLLSRRGNPFAVISSGTWTVVMANQSRLDRLQADRDMLANVDAFGSPVPTARFMGGREYEAIARTHEPPTFNALKSVIDRGAMARPAFALGGPFAHSKGQLLHAQTLCALERAALATLYVALMSDVLLESLGMAGDIIVDGPLASNSLFAAVLARLRSPSRVLAEGGRCALTAICSLSGYPQEREPPVDAVQPIKLDRLQEYQSAWSKQLPGANLALRSHTN